MTATQQRFDMPAWLRQAALPAAAVLLLVQAVVVAIWPAAHLLMIDLQVYRAGGEAVLHGAPLYAGGILLDLPFVYPPIAAVVFVPLTVLPLSVLKALWTAAGLAALVFVVRRCAGLAGLSTSPAVTTLLVAALLALDPIRTTFYLGQINVVLLALVLADLTGRPDGRLRGVGVGIAAAVKLTPLVFVVYLLLTGRARAAARAVATFAVAVGLGFLVAPTDSLRYWRDGTFAAADRISAVASTSNHSLNGVLARLGTPGWGGLAASAAVGIAGLAVAVLAHRRGEELLGVTLCGLLSAAVAPFAWSHHFVWFGPLVVLLAHHAASDRRAVAALAGLLVVTVAWVTRLPGPGVGPLPSTGLISLQPDVYLLAVAASLVVAWRGPAMRRDTLSQRRRHTGKGAGTQGRTWVPTP